MQAAPLFTGLAVRAASVNNTLLNPPTTITTTSTNFTTFLASMPWFTTFSTSAEVQVVLATFPLIALGFVGVGFAAFQLSISRVNRSQLDLWIAIGAAFVAGVFELFNVLNCELTASPTMGHPLIIAESVALATFLSFKLFYLYRRTQQPLQHESFDILPILPSSLAVSTRASERWSSVRRGFSFERPMVLHSGRYERWGVLGGVIKVAIFITILVTGLLDAIWRIGFLSDSSMFMGVYTASNALQIVLLVFFGGKLLYAAGIAKAWPRRRNYVEVTPTFFVILIALSIVIVNLIPGLLRFADTPLGRFFILVEMFILVLDTAIQDHQKPHRDTLSFDSHGDSDSKDVIFFSEKPSFQPNDLPAPQNPRAAETPSSSPPRGPSRATVAFETDEPALPERVVIRRASRLPSWLNQRRSATGSDTRVLVQPSPPPSPGEDISRDLLFSERRNSNEISGDQDLESRSQTVYSQFPPSEDPSEVNRITFTGGGPSVSSISDPGEERTRSRNPSLSTLRATDNKFQFPSTRPLDLEKPHRRQNSTLSVAPSLATYDIRGVRLTSPDLDLSFPGFTQMLRRQQQNTGLLPAANRSMPPPQTPPSNPPPPAPTRPAARPMQPSYSGVPSEYYALGESDTKLSEGSSGKSLERRSEASVATNATHNSDMSLSNFPAPPLEIPLPAPSSKSIVTDGLEFELLPPRPPFRDDDGRVRVNSQASQVTTFDITSMLGDSLRAGRLTTMDLDRISESGSDMDNLASLPVSPGYSEVGEIRQATVLARTGSTRASGGSRIISPPPPRARKESATVRVEERGRVIPPRDQDKEEAFGGREFALPSNPRRQSPRLNSLQQDNSRQAERSPTATNSTTETPDLSRSTSTTSNISPIIGFSGRFERPRPAPLVLSTQPSKDRSPPAPSNPFGVGVGFNPTQRPSAIPKRAVSRTRGGRKPIVVVRDQADEAGVNSEM